MPHIVAFCVLVYRTHNYIRGTTFLIHWSLSLERVINLFNNQYGITSKKGYTPLCVEIVNGTRTIDLLIENLRKKGYTPFIRYCKNFVKIVIHLFH